MFYKCSIRHGIQTSFFLLKVILVNFVFSFLMDFSIFVSPVLHFQYLYFFTCVFTLLAFPLLTFPLLTFPLLTFPLLAFVLLIISEYH